MVILTISSRILTVEKAKFVYSVSKTAWADVLDLFQTGSPLIRILDQCSPLYMILMVKEV